MCSMNILEVAKSIETALLNKIAVGDIGDYAIEVVHDDRKIEVWYTKMVIPKSIEVLFVIHKGQMQ